jgi:hypothetical protein
MPKFVGSEIAKYMDDTGITNPEVAYKAMHMDAIIDSRAKATRKATYSERGSAPMQTVNQNDREALKKEAKATNDWTKFLMNGGYVDNIK